MEVLKAASDISVHHFDTGAFNWYILSQQGRLTLVDAGFPGHYQIFLDGIQSMEKDLGNFEAIILTHSHADHTGFAERLRKITNIPVFIHQDDLAAVGRVLQLPWWGLLSSAWQPYVRSILGHAIGNGVFTMPHISKAYPFKDGDILDVPGKPQVFHIPGHTPGEVAFFLPDSGILFSGDTIITQNLLTGQPGQPQIPSRLLNDNDRKARYSIDRLKDLGQVTVLPGHGKSWTGLMSDAIQLARDSGAR